MRLDTNSLLEKVPPDEYELARCGKQAEHTKTGSSVSKKEKNTNRTRKQKNRSVGFIWMHPNPSIWGVLWGSPPNLQSEICFHRGLPSWSQHLQANLQTFNPGVSPVGIPIAFLNPYSQLGCRHPCPVHAAVRVMCTVGAVVGHCGLVPPGCKMATANGHDNDNDQEQDGSSTSHYVIPVGQNRWYWQRIYCWLTLAW